MRIKRQIRHENRDLLIGHPEQLTMRFTVCAVFLMSLLGSVLSLPLFFCQNMGRQTESIRNLLQSFMVAAKGITIDMDRPAQGKSKSNTDHVCLLAQRLASYQECDVTLSSEIIKNLNQAKTETKGLVENLEINFGCTPALPACPISNLNMWDKIDALLEAWWQDVAAHSTTLQGLCPHSHFYSFLS